jgi:Holliday junction resolvase RusA-like endonuclease
LFDLWVLDWCPVWKGSVQVMEIVVFGEPVPQGRPKFVRIGNHVHTYDPEKSRSYKQLVRFWVTQHLKKIDGFNPYENALCVDLTFYLGIPTSWTKKRKLEASQGQIRPTKKPDTDNLVKCVTDSCNGLLWVDDSIITDLTARKRYTSELARVVIKITEVQSC